MGIACKGQQGAVAQEQDRLDKILGNWLVITLVNPFLLSLWAQSLVSSPM